MKRFFIKTIFSNTHSFYLWLTIFGGLMGTTALILGWSYQNIKAEKLAFLKNDYKILLDQEKIKITSNLNNIISDLEFLNALLKLEKKSFRPNKETDSRFQKEIFLLSEARKIYLQIRLIDKTGWEKFRINYNGKQASIVPADQLQNKSQRYYFKETIALNPGQVFVSHLDLNIERGVVEKPFIPTLRIASPYADAKGNKLGIIVLNYHAKRLLNFSEKWNFELLNHEGYWLRTSPPKEEWGFMLGNSNTLGNQFPKEWEEILQLDKGTILTSNGLFVFQKIFPWKAILQDSTSKSSRFLSKNQNPFWVLLIHNPNPMKTININKARFIFGGLFVLLSLVYGVGGAILVSTLAKKKEAKENLLKAHKELHDFKTAMDEHSIVAITDVKGSITYANDKFCKISKYTREELLGQNHRILNSGHHPRKFFAQMWETISQGKTWQGEIKNKARDGSFYWVGTTIVPFLNEKGQPFQYIAVRTVLTKIKELEEELRQAKEAADVANEAKGSFLASMSHEIRTPMNGIIGMVNLLLKTDLNSKQRDLADTVSFSANSLLSILNDILDFSKIEAGKLVLENEPFNLRQLAEQVGQWMAATAAEKGLEPIFRYTPDMPEHFIGDATRIRQILTNLIGNAIKFTQKGHIFVNFQEKSQDKESVVVEIQVIDTGVGISKEQQEKLFKKFEQADSSTTRKFGGTGLGLAISKQLVEMMGGTIGISSKPGKGSTFSLTLALKKNLNLGQEATLKTIGLREDFSDMRILVIEDNEIYYRTILEYLKMWKIPCEQISSSEEFLSILLQAHEKGFPYKMVLVDETLPGINSASWAKTVKAHPALKDVKLIALSFLQQTESETGFFSAYISKPLRASELLNTFMDLWIGKKMLTGCSFAGRPSKETHHFNTQTKILLVEDNPINQQVAMGALQEHGFSAVDVAEDGMKALEKVGKFFYDLIFMDCSMPRMDGYEATQKIRQKEGPNQHTPIVAMTANAFKEDREKCLAVGMDDYVSKPIQEEVLNRILEKYCSGKTVEEIPEYFSSPKPPTEEHIKVMNSSVDPNILDCKKIYGLFGGNVALLKKIVATSEKGLADLLQELNQAAEKKEPPEIERTSHSLQGALANLGSKEATQIAKSIELLAHKGRIEDCLPKLQSLAEAVERFQKEFKSVDWENFATESPQNSELVS